MAKKNIPQPGKKFRQLPTKFRQPDTAQDIEREAANKAGEERREREKAARRANAEKQRRYRASMRAQGYKQTTVWVKPPPSGMVETTAVIHQTTIGIADTAPEIKQALSRALGSFYLEVEKLPRSAWRNVYKDIQELLRPLGEL
jgi:hypothetical protein